jgi:hypothetical protein
MFRSIAFESAHGRMFGEPLHVVRTVIDLTIREHRVVRRAVENRRLDLPPEHRIRLMGPNDAGERLPLLATLVEFAIERGRGQLVEPPVRGMDDFPIAGPETARDVPSGVLLDVRPRHHVRVHIAGDPAVPEESLAVELLAHKPATDVILGWDEFVRQHQELTLRPTTASAHQFFLLVTELTMILRRIAGVRTGESSV